ncbi:unnamed protein product (macronuclear) [Paramecium tetraurelia]|uniref:Uncharacterized protein n=1 Tax=Paramecium tetraurelia TaxID=5888 RepID=A0CRM5_PARTE|nr:uncharacterized protein GSPATT00009757001 [Paramecium tetraurelia]CAK73442.1 unnamed protein product [Paramecium tetraurelia]|eukprot:XP_001440839.1 hypothetical protein (macronuclear) [Paramecium tetraurelia strain d4-2]
MNSYDVKGFDFTRDDGLVTVRVKQKESNQVPNQVSNKVPEPIQKQINVQLIKSKYRCLKSDIQSLKTLLKRSYNLREFKEFYRVYGPKLIEIDFGLIELFNVKGENQFSINEIEKFQYGLHFIRWGILFTIAHLQGYKDGSQLKDQIIGLQYYNMLVKERVFTLRTLRYYKNDIERKKFPYQYLFIYDLEDNLKFSLSFFQEYLSNQQDHQIQQIKQQEELLPTMKTQFYQNYFKDFQFTNIIAPFFQVKKEEQEQPQIQLFFIHFSLDGYQFKNYQNSNDVSQSNQEYKCYIFVNFDTTFYSQVQLQNGAREFANIHNFIMSNSDIQFINIKNQGNNFLEEYVKYIESEFFLLETSIENQMNYIFNELPTELSKVQVNSTINDKFIIPQNVQNVMKQLFGEVK